MKAFWNTTGRGLIIGGILGAVLALSGCKAGPSFFDVPSSVQSGATETGRQTTGNPTITSGGMGTGNVFQVGDLVTVTFSGVSDPTAMPSHTEKVANNGCINLDYIGQIKAAGKTAGELQMEIQTNYVPKYFQNLTVTVVPPAQYYYVGGEVKMPGAKDYLGQTDVIKAIQSAGDFTDFANKKKVKLTRSNGQQVTVNVIKALQDAKYDAQVYPGDTIHVPRRWY